MNTGDRRNQIHPIFSHHSSPISVFSPPQPSSDSKSTIQKKRTRSGLEGLQGTRAPQDRAPLLSPPFLISNRKCITHSPETKSSNYHLWFYDKGMSTMVLPYNKSQSFRASQTLWQCFPAHINFFPYFNMISKSKVANGQLSYSELPIFNILPHVSYLYTHKYTHALT